MCGRYTLRNVEDLSERFQVRQVPLELSAAYNIAPSQELPVIVEQEDGERVVRLMQWGLIPRWQRSGQVRGVAPINARAESVAEKPMFRDLIRLLTSRQLPPLVKPGGRDVSSRTTSG